MLLVGAPVQRAGRRGYLVVVAAPIFISLALAVLATCLLAWQVFVRRFFVCLIQSVPTEVIDSEDPSARTGFKAEKVSVGPSLELVDELLEANVLLVFDWQACRAVVRPALVQLDNGGHVESAALLSLSSGDPLDLKPWLNTVALLARVFIHAFVFIWVDDALFCAEDDNATGNVAQLAHGGQIDGCVKGNRSEALSSHNETLNCL